MKTNRRNFLQTAAIAGGASALLPLGSCCEKKEQPSSKKHKVDYVTLDEVLNLPVLKRELFPDPIIIETLELLWDRNNTICRVCSKDGAIKVTSGSGLGINIDPDYIKTHTVVS